MCPRYTECTCPCTFIGLASWNPSRCNQLSSTCKRRNINSINFALTGTHTPLPSRRLQEKSSEFGQGGDTTLHHILLGCIGNRVFYPLPSNRPLPPLSCHLANLICTVYPRLDCKGRDFMALNFPELGGGERDGICWWWMCTDTVFLWRGMNLHYFN